MRQQVGNIHGRLSAWMPGKPSVRPGPDAQRRRARRSPRITLLLALLLGTLITAAPPTTVQAGLAAQGKADFNGDGIEDLAIGVKDEDVGSVPSAGAVQVMYGSSVGLSSLGNQLWHQDSNGIHGSAERSDRFGDNLAVGDFDRDGYSDLAIGVTYEDVDGVENAGAVNVIYGGPGGLSSDGNQLWTQNSPDITGVAQSGDYFGVDLAAGDFDKDGFYDLAIGAAYEDVDGVTEGGVVHILYGTTAGLSSAGSQLWSQNSPDIDSSVETGDRFGDTLATGDFNRDGFHDLVIGSPLENVSSVLDGGAIHVLYGGSGGLRAAGSQIWHQDSDNILGTAGSEEWFGWSLAAGDFNADGIGDLAIGVRHDLVGNVVNAGAVQVLYGTTSGLSSSGNQLWSQNSANVLDASEVSDMFGDALAVSDFNKDGVKDLAIGVWREAVDGLQEAGAVNVLYGGSGGLASTGNQFWSQNSQGVIDDAESSDYFGRALAAGDYNQDGFGDLVVGVPNESVSGVEGAGALHVLYGRAGGLSFAGQHFWHQASPDINGSAEDDDEFGGELR